MEPVLRRSVVDELEGRLGEEILDGRLAAGELLPPERTLAERHGVTRTTLRQALGRLEQWGLIQTRQGSGSRVRSLEEAAGADVLPLITAGQRSDWIGEIFEARRHVGALVARRAAVRRTPGHARRLRELEAAIRSAPDAAEAQRLEVELHRVLAQATGNRVFALLVNSMLRAYQPLHRRLRPAFAEPAAVADWLAPVVEAVERGRASAAERAATRYFAETEHLMLGELAPRDAR